MLDSDTPLLTRDVRQTSGGFELVLSPVLLALIGYWLDRTLDLVPVLTVAFAVVGLIGVVIKLVVGYDREMAGHAEGAAWNRSESAT